MDKVEITDGKLFLPTIGAFLKSKREKAGLKQTDVEDAIDIKRYNIGKYEKGEVDIPTSKLPELCQLYKCRMGDCGSRVDGEIGFYKASRDAAQSKFTDMQYMSFAMGTPMVDADYEQVDEVEFQELIKALIRFRERELAYMELPSEDALKRLRHNFAFFMVEFIKKNTVDKDKRERLLALCNEALKEDLQTNKKERKKNFPPNEE